MRRSGFTMIELIFVIVILGILAAVALPKMAATRDDAKAASMKTDVGTAINAIPAWYQGQKDAVIANGMAIDTNTWVKDSSGEAYTWTESGASNACITISVCDCNSTNCNPAGAETTTNVADGTFTLFPTLKITQGGVSDINGTVTITETNHGTVCDILWNDMGLSEQTIRMGGSRVVW